MTRAGLLIGFALLAIVAGWLFATGDDRRVAAEHYRQQRKQDDARLQAEQTKIAAVQRACEQGFAIAARELDRVSAGKVWHRFPDRVMIVFEKPAELAALARTARVQALPLARVAIAMSACSARLGRGHPVPRFGAPVHAFGIPTSFRHIGQGPLPERIAFQSSVHQGSISLMRSDLKLRNRTFLYTNNNWPLGIKVEKIGTAMDVILIVNGSKHSQNTLLSADRAATALIPWLNRLDAMTVAETKRAIGRQGR